MAIACSSGTTNDTGGGGEKAYTCPGGLAEVGTTRNANTVSCTNCFSGFFSNPGSNGKQQCSARTPYTCENGIARSGTANQLTAIESCVSCNTGFRLSGTSCAPQFRYTCSNGTPTNGFVDVATESCTGCNAGYILFETSCPASAATWTTRPILINNDVALPIIENLRAITHGKGESDRFMTVVGVDTPGDSNFHIEAFDGTVTWSGNGLAWTGWNPSVTSGSSTIIGFHGITFADDLFVAVGNDFRSKTDFRPKVGENSLVTSTYGSAWVDVYSSVTNGHQVKRDYLPSLSSCKFRCEPSCCSR